MPSCDVLLLAPMPSPKIIKGVTSKLLVSNATNALVKITGLQCRLRRAGLGREGSGGSVCMGGGEGVGRIGFWGIYCDMVLFVGL